jgi:hypothetical protein
VLPLVVLMTAAGILSLGLAVIASWAALTILLLILELETKAYNLKSRAAHRLHPTRRIANEVPKNR